MCMIKGNDPAYAMRDLDRSGAIHGVIRALKLPLSYDVLTITAETLGAILKGQVYLDHNVITPLHNPYSK